MINRNGVVLHEGPNVVIIATGLKAASTNEKTVGMVQIYILYRHESPMDAVKSGNDALICGSCPHRAKYDVDGVMVPGSRRCYVNLGKGARAVYECYARGGYRHAAANEVPEIFAGRLVRFGTYGDPAFMPEWLLKSIASVAKRWTGYTHQWARPEFAWLRDYLMASCDSVFEADTARADGWRRFRVARLGDSGKMAGEISCPASKEAGKRTTCERCALCDGARDDNDRRKSIVIQDHSKIARTKPLVQIAGIR